jgi:hypothetical protein
MVCVIQVSSHVFQMIKHLGLCVAQVHVIFSLPEEYGSYKHPLAYVDWYKPFRTPVPDLNMHQVSLSSHNHHQCTSVIPVTDILQICHLQPHYG